MSESKGVIYILTNPSFPQYVKIGFANDMNRRLAELNRSECVPFAFRVYATYEVESNLSDKRVHDIIDRLNPELRAIENFEGKQRKREFYAMSKEDAFSILEAIAEINGREEHLHLHILSEEERQEEAEAKEIETEHTERLAPFSFDKVNLMPGDEIVFTCRNNEYSGKKCKVVTNKQVEFDGKKWSLSALATHLTNSKRTVAGPCYFKYNGRWLNDIRDENEGRTKPRKIESWVIPSNPKNYDIIGAFNEFEVIEWSQSTYVQEGDLVYIYVGGEYKSLMYKCIAEETDLYGAGEIDDLKYFKDMDKKENRRYMRLRLVERYVKDRYPYSELKVNGLNSVQGPSKVTPELEAYLKGE